MPMPAGSRMALLQSPSSITTAAIDPAVHREAGEERLVRGDDHVGGGDLGAVALLEAAVEEAAAAAAAGTGGLVHLEPGVDRRPDRWDVTAHRRPRARVGGLVSAEHGDAHPVCSPGRRGFVGERVRRGEHQQARRPAGGEQARPQRQQRAAGTGALAEPDGGLDPDPRRGRTPGSACHASMRSQASASSASSRARASVTGRAGAW